MATKQEHLAAAARAAKISSDSEYLQKLVLDWIRDFPVAKWSALWGKRTFELKTEDVTSFIKSIQSDGGLENISLRSKITQALMILRDPKPDYPHTGDKRCACRVCVSVEILEYALDRKNAKDERLAEDFEKMVHKVVDPIFESFKIRMDDVEKLRNSFTQLFDSYKESSQAIADAQVEPGHSVAGSIRILANNLAAIRDALPHALEDCECIHKRCEHGGRLYLGCDHAAAIELLKKILSSEILIEIEKYKQLSHNGGE